MSIARLAAFAATALLAFASTTDARSIRVMPLGDSITESVTTFASYRYYLWQDLMAAGHDVDFVGSNTGVRLGPPLFDEFDQDHEGHTGLRTDEVLAEIATWASAAQPDIVLIHLGTNDLWQGRNHLDVRNDMEGIIDALRQVNPHVTILLAKIIPSELFDVRRLNRSLDRLAAVKWRPNSQVRIVDQYSGFDASSDTYDGVHPDLEGEEKIATEYFRVLDWFLRRGPRLTGELTGTRVPVAPSASVPAPWTPWFQRRMLRLGLVEFERVRQRRAR